MNAFALDSGFERALCSLELERRLFAESQAIDCLMLETMRDVTQERAPSFAFEFTKLPWRVNIQSGSRTSARKLRVKSSVRGRASSRLKAYDARIRKSRRR